MILVYIFKYAAILNILETLTVNLGEYMTGSIHTQLYSMYYITCIFSLLLFWVSYFIGGKVSKENTLDTLTLKVMPRQV